MTLCLMISEIDTTKSFSFVDEGAGVECPLNITVSIPAISTICFSHLEIVEEDIAL